MQRIRVFLSANEPMLHRLVSHFYNSLFTFSAMESRVKWAYLELQKVKMSEALKSKKKNPLFSFINSGKLETTVTPRLHYTRLFYTSFPETFNIPVLMCWPWILLSIVAQFVVMAIFSWRTPVLFYWYRSFKFNSLPYYTMLYFSKRKTIRFNSPLIHYSETKRFCG